MHRNKQAKPSRPPPGPKLVCWGIGATVGSEPTLIDLVQIDGHRFRITPKNSFVENL
jgi:hypothetical protein